MAALKFIKNTSSLNLIKNPTFLLRNENIYNKNILTIDNILDNDILSLFNLTDYLKYNDDYNFINFNGKKSLGLLFFEPSTRTRMSFELAAKKIGLYTLIETNPNQNMSIAKQESLHDTLKTISNYVDGIVLRHPDEKEVFKNIENIDVPIINAGWGNYGHPTQALIDLYTFKNKFKNLKQTKLAIVGDPNRRTVKSICKLANRLEMPLTIIYPNLYKYQPHNLDYSFNSIIANNKYEFQEAAKEQDILYYSKFTHDILDNKNDNLFDNYKEQHIQWLAAEHQLVRKNTNNGTIHSHNIVYETIDNYYLPLSFLEENNVYIYSPLPRHPNEMDKNVDNTKYQLSFEGVKNSVYIRMALLNLILND